MAEHEDCPVEEATCIARMQTLATEIKGIKNTVITCSALLGLVLAALQIYFNYIHK